MFSRIRNINIAEVFTLDLRSLALTRILVALILLTDLFARLPSLTTFIGDAGVFPSSLLHSTWIGDWAWSLHLLDGGSTWLLFALVGVQIVSAAALCVGYRTRIATTLSWILLVSLHNANPFMLQGGDFWLRAILFTGMFLPWGAVFSFDSRWKQPASLRLLSGWSVAYLIQVGLFYFFASLYKTGAEWTKEGSAVYYALSLDQYATPLAKFLLQFPDFLAHLTVVILLVQHVTLFLIFIPWRNALFRTFSVGLIAFWHIALAACLHLGMFSWISIAAVVALIPGAAWDAARARLNDAPAKLTRYARLIPVSSAVPATQNAVISVLGTVYLLYVTFWQFADYTRVIQAIPEAWQVPAKVLRIDQKWNLFAPYPFKNDGWYVMEGRLSDGSSVNLFNDLPLTVEKPENVFAHYPNMRWRKYTYELRRDGNRWMLPYLGAYLCRSVPTGSGARLESVHVTYVIEMTAPPGAAAAEPLPVKVLDYQCLAPLEG